MVEPSSSREIATRREITTPSNCINLKKKLAQVFLFSTTHVTPSHPNPKLAQFFVFSPERDCFIRHELDAFGSFSIPSRKSLTDGATSCFSVMTPLSSALSQTTQHLKRDERKLVSRRRQALYFDRYTRLLAPDLDPLRDDRVTLPNGDGRADGLQR